MHLTIGTINITFVYQSSLPSDNLCAKSDTLIAHYIQMNGGLDTWRDFWKSNSSNESSLK